MNPQDQDPNEDDNEGADPDVTGAAPVRLHPSPLDLAFAKPNGRPNASTDLVWTRDALALPPISLRAGNITEIDGYEKFGGWGLEHVANAMTGLHDACANIIEARKSVQADPTMTDAARAIAVGDLADKLTAKVTKSVDSSLAC